MKEFIVHQPDLQIDFFYRLKELKKTYFFSSLRRTVKELNIPDIDRELEKYVNPGSLNKVASSSLRGEVFFPLPIIIKANPKLVGYYRLLYGISQKAFYSGEFSKFKKLEEDGIITENTMKEILPFCVSLIKTGQILVHSIDEISLDTVYDLQLITLGPQLRGSRSTQIGEIATNETFNIIRGIVEKQITAETEKEILIKNNSNRIISIKFSSDPDISVLERFENGREEPLIAIEIKGGRDFSNIHNRIGEAEKSHQKAKRQGYFHLWTILRVDIDYEILKKESPSTTNFFNLDNIQDPENKEYEEFRSKLNSHLGI